MDFTGKAASRITGRRLAGSDATNKSALQSQCDLPDGAAFPQEDNADHRTSVNWWGPGPMPTPATVRAGATCNVWPRQLHACAVAAVHLPAGGPEHLSRTFPGGGESSPASVAERQPSLTRGGQGGRHGEKRPWTRRQAAVLVSMRGLVCLEYRQDRPAQGERRQPLSAALRAG